MKEIVYRVAKSLGAFAAVRDSRWRRKRLLILCYHGVSMDDEHEWDPALYITPDMLRQRLRLLRAGDYAILPLADAMRRLHDGTLPKRSVALTFDDGAVDFERRALPVLREFNAPATLYLTTYYCVHRLPVFDTVLSYVLWKGRASGGDVSVFCESPRPLPVATHAERVEAGSRLKEFARRGALDAPAKNEMVAQIAKALGVDFHDLIARELLHIMSPAVVGALPRDLVDVQLHTHRHRTPRDRTEFIREIRDNMTVAREMLGPGAVLEHFCYPSGEYFGEFLPWLRECGVRFATTCVPGLVDPSTDPLLIPRFVDTMAQSDLTFEAWASGFAAFVPRRREYRLDGTRLATAPK